MDIFYEIVLHSILGWQGGNSFQQHNVAATSLELYDFWASESLWQTLESRQYKNSLMDWKKSVSFEIAALFPLPYRQVKTRKSQNYVSMEQGAVLLFL